MELKEIVLNNRIIDIFMGKSDFHDQAHVAMEDLEYHCSWDWLMPVVEKITRLEEVEQVSVGSYKTRIWLAKSSFIEAPFDPDRDMKQECYATVVKFIEWYNKQQKKS